jgi:hypothetical protein
MDASNTCQLVNTVPFSNYNQIVTPATTLIEFSMNSNYVTGKFTPNPLNDFTSFISTSNSFPMGRPTLPSGKNSLVTGYLAYPKSAVFKEDYYTESSFRDLTSISLAIITAGDLCSSSNIYNTNVYTGSSDLSTLSLTTLYHTLARSNLNPADKTAIQSQIDTLQNKNKMFYSFFVYEYCYYNTMYTELLRQFFQEYSLPAGFIRFPNIAYLKDSDGLAVVNDSIQGTHQSSRLDAIIITLARVNSRLIDMRNLLFTLQNYYSESLQNFQKTLNSNGVYGSDADAEAKIISLMAHSSKVEHIKDESTFRQGIVEYTSEKNRYSNILLGIYAFLNIAIIAVIFNIKE